MMAVWNDYRDGLLRTELTRYLHERTMAVDKGDIWDLLNHAATLARERDEARAERDAAEAVASAAIERTAALLEEQAVILADNAALLTFLRGNSRGVVHRRHIYAEHAHPLPWPVNRCALCRLLAQPHPGEAYQARLRAAEQSTAALEAWKAAQP